MCTSNFTSTKTSEAKPELVPKLVNVQNEAADNIFQKSSSDSRVLVF